MGAGDHAASPAPLFHRDHACGLSQRYGARGTVGRLCGAGRFRPCLWYVGYTDLQETDVGAHSRSDVCELRPQSAWKRVFRWKKRICPTKCMYSKNNPYLYENAPVTDHERCAVRRGHCGYSGQNLCMMCEAEILAFLLLLEYLGVWTTSN